MYHNKPDVTYLIIAKHNQTLRMASIKSRKASQLNNDIYV